MAVQSLGHTCPRRCARIWGDRAGDPSVSVPHPFTPLSVQHLLICVLPQRMEMGQTCWTQTISVKGLWDRGRCRNGDGLCRGRGQFPGPSFHFMTKCQAMNNFGGKLIMDRIIFLANRSTLESSMTLDL